MRRPRLATVAATALVAVALAGQAAPAPLSVGFYLPWDAASKASLIAHAGRLDVLAPMSGALDTPQGHVRWQDDPALVQALAAAKDRPKVFPIVSNAHDTVWDAAAAEAALTDPAVGEAFIAALTAQAQAKGYGGYIMDFENLTPRATAAYAAFLARLRAALRPAGRELWVTAAAAADPTLIQALATSTDSVVLMAYDECWATSTPGPVAGLDWLARNLDARLAGPDAGRFIVALGAYGYDWPQGEVAAELSTPDAQALAQRAGQAVTRNAPDGNPHFAYPGPDGKPHQVWFLDAGAYRAQRAVVLAHHARGVALWRLGLEDPALWSSAGPPPTLGGGTPAPACTALPPKG
jgi:spore germination protein YaaH